MSGAPVSATVVHPGGIKTAVARASRAHASLETLGLDAERSREKFEELFITEADKAAGAILRAVERDKRRVLVGPDAYVIDAIARLLPGAYQHIVKRFVLKALS